MAAEYIGIAFKFLSATIKFLPKQLLRVWSYFRRPKLRFSLRYTHVECRDYESRRVLPSFPGIRIHNAGSSELTFDLGRFFVNGESLTYIIQQNIYYCRTLEQTKDELKLSTENQIFTVFRENWTSAKFLKLPAHQHFDVPLYPKKVNETTWFKVINESRVFFPSKKIVLRVGVNSEDYDYAVRRMDFLKMLFNSLVNKCPD